MPALAVFPFPSLDSLSTIEGYLTLTDPSKYDPKPLANGHAVVENKTTRKKKKKKKRRKLSSFVQTAQRAFLTVFRNFCIHVSDATDNDSLLAGGQNKIPSPVRLPEKAEHYDSLAELSIADKVDDLSWDSSADFLESVQQVNYGVFQPWTSTPRRPQPELVRTAVIEEVEEARLRRAVLVSSGMQKLEDSKSCVLESRQRLEALKMDVAAVRNEIQRARALFRDVERGIRDYKWELVDRDSWMVLLHPKAIYSSPGNRFGKSHLEQMYREHRIFVEQMKFHFKWEHGVII